MLGFLKVLSEMANREDEDFISHSVTGMTKYSTLFQPM